MMKLLGSGRRLTTLDTGMLTTAIPRAGMPRGESEYRPTRDTSAWTVGSNLPISCESALTPPSTPG